MVSRLSPSPHPRSFQIPLPSCSKYAQVENYSIRLPGASSSRPSCHPRRDTSARWVSPRRRRWPPADTWRWPPSPAQGRPRPNFSCTNIGFVWVGVRLMIPLSNRCVRHSVGILWVDYKPFHEEHEFSCGVRGPDDSLWCQTSSEAPQLLCLRIKWENSTLINQEKYLHQHKPGFITKGRQKKKHVCTANQWFSTAVVSGPTFYS